MFVFTSHAIHIEMIKNMNTDSFLLALKRFIGRHGNIRTIWCENGRNCVGGRDRDRDRETETETETES